MGRLTYGDEQIAYARRQTESGAALTDVCRQFGISEATF